jgi:hypothetical protein
MLITTSRKLKLSFVLLVCVLIVKVTVGVVLNYTNYFPPVFASGFLVGRESYFYTNYQWAFYTHIVSSPFTLVLGLLLLNERFRVRHTKWHRFIGSVQVGLVLLLVSPSGFWMAFYAATGTVASVGFGSLAIATGVFSFLGWRSAVKRRFTEHRCWMWRCYLVLCSAVVLRLTAGLATVVGIEEDWPYPMAAWTSWLIPLAIYELVLFKKTRKRSAQLVSESADAH